MVGGCIRNSGICEAASRYSYIAGTLIPTARSCISGAWTGCLTQYNAETNRAEAQVK